MKRILSTCVVICAAMMSLSVAAQTPLGTVFTYQGELKNAGSPANGLHDLRFQLFTAVSGGTQVGPTICVDAVTVDNGLFMTSLDFGAAFDGNQRFLQVFVRADSTPGNCGSGTYTMLTPRQPLTAVPYALYALTGPGSGGPWATSGNNIFNTNTGNIGIGTTTPQAPLELRAPNVGALPGEGIRVQGTLTTVANQAYVSFHNGSGTAIGYVGDGSTGDNTVFLGAYVGDVCLVPATRALTAKPDGRVGIGTSTPVDRFHVIGNVRADGSLRSYHSSGAGEVQLGWGLDGQGADVARIRIGGSGPAYNGLDIQTISDRSLMRITHSGFVGIGTTTPNQLLDVNGTARVKVLEITGADIAEKFPTSETLEPGMVVAIDAKNAGKLCLSRGAYNRCVAGVVSGANNFSAGAVLGNLPGHEDAPAIALSGRVYVQCDATSAPIEPGDLLTTSDTPGHAMRATDGTRLTGSVIGKAMTGLPQGQRGLVLVLVNLQ